MRNPARSSRALLVVLVLALCCGLAPAGAVTPETTPVAPAAKTIAPARATGRDFYVPKPGVKFNHWNIKGMVNPIRRHMIRTINSTPPGSTIRWIVFSFGDWGIYNALIRAKRRGVSVQVIANFHNQAIWAEWRSLEKALGTRRVIPGRDPERISWARMCVESCRGWGGHVHLKLYLFSKVTGHQNIVMYGSWNPTWVANQRQWNHLETVWDTDTYRKYMQIFRQAKRDSPAPYAHWYSGNMEHMVFPKEHTVASTDPVWNELGNLKCTGATDRAGYHGRTVIRIGMYAWYQRRGDWMARRVRRLWEQGCDVRIIYGIMSDQARQILYSRSGRGRIPMRQAMVPDANGVPYRYLHDKFVAISGVYADRTDAYVVWSGSTNFSNLGFSADDMTVRQVDKDITEAYFADWRITWNGPNVHAPSHGPLINPEGRSASGQLSNRLPAPLGKGIYTGLDAD
jgi:phosphatidylserine/phosphatidylglycerophosphate/cardiolipin synthase-like enzyme